MANNNTIKTVAICTLILLANVSATAGQGLITDRPDFTESGVVVPVGTIQLEAGATIESFSASGGGGADHLTIGEALLRWGVMQRLEARLEIPNYNRVSFGEGSNSFSIDGFGDTSLGVKYQIGPFGDDQSIDFGVIGMVSLPTGSADFTSDEFEPEAILAASKAVGPNLSLGGQVSAGLPSTGDGRAVEWGLTIVSATSFRSVGIFVEFRIDVPEEGTAPLFVHTGFIVPVGDRLQFDVHGGFGISETAPDTFIGAGFAGAI